MSQKKKKSLRAAIYARYSTTKQRDASIDDQNRNCERLAKREGWDIVHRFSDKGLSGARHDRPDYQRMIKAAAADEFDVLLTDDLSRLGRDSLERERIIRRFEQRHRIRIIAVSDGYDSESKSRKIQRGFKNIMDELYIDELAAKTHRGLEGQVLKHLSAGGRAYGYTSKPVVDPAGGTDRYGRPKLLGYSRIIDKSKRKHVVEIFQMYADGMNPKAIARELNANGIPSPSADWKRTGGKRTDGKWMASAIYSLLNNEIYIGEVVWNKSRFERDPDTGKRFRVSRPEHEWHRDTQKSLRIVSEKIWHQVKARQLQMRKDSENIRGALKNGNKPGRKPTNFWSGLLCCGSCGRNYIKVSRYEYGCGSHANGGKHACANDLRAKISILDRRVIPTIQSELLSEEWLLHMKRHMKKHLERRLSELARTDNRAQTERRLATVNTELKNVADAVAEIGWHPALKEKIEDLTDEKRQLGARLETAEVDPRLATSFSTVLPALMEKNIKTVLNFSELKNDSPHAVAKARSALQKLTGRIELNPTGRRNDRLVAKLELTNERIQLLADEALKGQSQQKQLYIKMVAGAGFEPATFGL